MDTTNCIGASEEEKVFVHTGRCTCQETRWRLMLPWGLRVQGLGGGGPRSNLQGTTTNLQMEDEKKKEWADGEKDESWVRRLNRERPYAAVHSFIAMGSCPPLSSPGLYSHPRVIWSE
ncbi:hypothetical protein J4Q44_G00191290 [Coregonus suidteri]|uniref:Uncharacterized protein n=1 Tax=Coregonus suidteri TaxID=861788 RepID=A0AAN8QNS8_9TELE